MGNASLVGLACLIVSFAATIMAIVRARKLGGGRGFAVAAVVLLLIHPTVWIGVSSGDCGRTLLIAGPVMVALHLGIAGFLMIRK